MNIVCERHTRAERTIFVPFAGVFGAQLKRCVARKKAIRVRDTAIVDSAWFGWRRHIAWGISMENKAQLLLSADAAAAVR